MRRRNYLFVGVIAAVLVAVVAVWRYSAAAQPGAQNEPERAPGMSLPLTEVILFNSGVGYFQREGPIEGATRVDLTFPVTDVPDLLKSLVLPDASDAKVTVNYDSEEPVDRTLKSFALDLTNNPTLGQILNQARGEKIEVVLQQNGATQPGSLTGVIVGMEEQSVPGPKDTMVTMDMLNMLCAEGVREVPLTQVQRLRFLNPSLDSEFHRALDVLAAAHNSQKRTVSLNFTGDGKRTAKVGYVVENPIWKTSYRLVLDKKGKPTLQGWAIVENTSDEDWKDVRMALISSRPISFQMDLYQPLFIPRPTVEPELFASLRPPTYQGAMNGGQIGGFGGGGFQFGGGGFPGANGQNWGAQNAGGRFNNPNSPQQNGAQLGNIAQNMNPNNNDNGNFNNSVNNKLSYEEMQQRRQQLRQNKDNAKKIGSIVALDPSGVASVANADEIGDYFQYNIDQKVTLPRQKSAMLPIVNQPVEGKRVSIYNEAIQAKFPLLGLRFKNTTGQDLMQGPVSVYEGGTYAGDGRIMDLQPNEERLLSYAIDQGVEIKAEGTVAPQQLISVKVVKGIMQVTHKLRETRLYHIKNRSPEDRDLIVEHPIREEWKLVTPEKASEVSRDVYRFDLSVASGQSAKQEVVEERSQLSAVSVSTADDNTIKIFLSGNVASPKLKDALSKALDFRSQLAATQRDLTQLNNQLKAITDDQVRLRANLDKMPATSAAYKRYLDKFDQQETEIEKIQKSIGEKQDAAKAQQAAYEDYLAGLSVD
ncbi:MAG TPA: DUF4139 domain-containing protein [Gemmataceae bacterium]|nr:DUF4139 domain-containing protein [Gemmataceae bacterium]